MGLFSFLGGKSPEEIEQQGDKYFKIQEFGAAKIEYENALEKARKKFPEKTGLISRLSDKLARSKNALADAHLQTARALIQSGNDEEAEGFLQLILELSSDERTKDLAMAELKIIGKNVHRHVPEGRETNETVFTHVDPEGDKKHGDDYFAILCSTLPEDLQEQYHGYGDSFKSGFIALNSGNFEKAARYLTKAMAEHPDPTSQIPVELSTALIHLRRFDEAIEILKQFLKNNPESLRGYQALCDAYWDSGDFDRAAALLHGAPNPLKHTLPMRMLLGETLYLSQRYGESIRVFEKIIVDFGFNEITGRSLAKAYEASGDVHRAKDVYAQIMKGCKSCGTRMDPFIIARYADLCFQCQDISASLLDIYFSLVQQDPDNKYHYYQRIYQIYEHVGNSEQARRYRAMAESTGP